jgi:hypothetical protein
MQTRTLFRWLTAFTLEAYIAAGLLTLFGYLPTTFASMFGFTVIASLLLAFGGWLYQGGGRSVWLHLLLYPLILAAGLVSYQVFDSWLAAILLAGSCFWRIHTIVTIRLYHFDLLRRFALAVLPFMGSLIYQALIVPIYTGKPDGIVPLFEMLTALLLSFLVSSWGEFLTREKPSGITVAPPLRWRFALELGQAKLMMLGAYTLLASAVFFLGSVLWTWVKPLLGTFLYHLFAPLLRLIEQWISQLTLVLSKDKRIDLVTGNDGEAGKTIDYGQGAEGETLFSILQPYLIGLVVLVFAGWLGWKMWQRRHRPQESLEAAGNAPAQATIRPVEQSHAGDAGLGGRFRAIIDQWLGPRDDKARYLYYQFLRYMAAQGLAMRKDETSREFMRRVQSAWTDERRVSLVSQITDYYQRHRYDQKPLSAEDIAALEQCFQQLKSRT